MPHGILISSELAQTEISSGEQFGRVSQDEMKASIQRATRTDKLDAFISCIYIANESLIGLYSCLPWKML